jgi:succinyl-CoA synthetase beta subunit
VHTCVDVAVTTSYLWKLVQSFKVPVVHSISIVLVDVAVTLVICGASAGTMSVESLEAETPKSLVAKELPHRSLT